ncbi:MAG: hypothetical protein BWZ02_01429 [Lentisphaerae bacterium ADurb.BinA184]|nr:MAG: hypothetical protein BWZ02_01429 [Lentisphaerae bacterium ADurb.BinA184]
MNAELLAVIDYLENERRIDRETLIALIEESLLAAARKVLGPANELRVTIDRETGDIRALATVTVVDYVRQRECEVSLAEARRRVPGIKLGETLEWEVTPDNFGRIAAQNAKQSIMQRLREAEKVRVCEEYQSRVGQLVSGVVVRVERGDVYVDLTRAEGVMHHPDRIPGEEYQPGDHYTGVLVRVNPEGIGPSLVLSRAHPDLVVRLFEREVSEIAEHVVDIKLVAREPGYRSKIAVAANDPSVDPVGACVGVRGNRVKTVVRELGGEKVDIIPWAAEPRAFVTNALQPAKLAGIEVDEPNHVMHVIVPEDQLSLAIGKKGQNARLAAKLTGWRIDIRRQEKVENLEFEDKVQRAIQELVERVPVLTPEVATALVKNGFISLEGIVEAEVGDLTAVAGIDSELAQQILDAARKAATP